MNQAQATVQAALAGQLPVRYNKNAAGQAAGQPIIPIATQTDSGDGKIYCRRIKDGCGHAKKVSTDDAKKKRRGHLKVCQRCNRCVAAA